MAGTDVGCLFPLPTHDSKNGAGERNRTVALDLASPRSAIELHPRKHQPSSVTKTVRPASSAVPSAGEVSGRLTERVFGGALQQPTGN